MDHSITIETPRLVCKPFTKDFVTQDYIGWLNDKTLMKYSEQRHRIHDHDSCLLYLNSFEGTPHYFWAITLKDNQQHIGNINAYVNLVNDVADIGLLIGELSMQGQGMGHEAFNAVCEHLLNAQGIRKITAGAMRANAPMIKIMERCAMIEDGVRKDHFLMDDQPVDLVHMALYRKD